jgi:cytochrome c6
MTQKMRNIGQCARSEPDTIAAGWFHDGRGISRRTAPTNGARPMKKIIILAITLGFTAAMTASAADAKENYDKSCAKCHGADGKGQTKMGQKLGIKDYTDAKVQAELKDDVAFKSIKEGLKDKDGKTLMKPVEDLTDADIKALVAHMHTFKQ